MVYNKGQLGQMAKQYGFNMTIFNLPRLSIDLDLDFTPNLCLEDMEEVREKITRLLKGYMAEEGYFFSGRKENSN